MRTKEKSKERHDTLYSSLVSTFIVVFEVLPRDKI